MFINIKFKDSTIKGYFLKKDYNDCIENENIPINERNNIFTQNEVNKLNSILDKPLELNEIKRCCLENNQIHKQESWYFSTTEERENYEKIYSESEGINLYVVRNSGSYIVDSDLLFSITNDFDTKVLYEVVGTLKDLPSSNQSKEIKVLDSLLRLEEKLSLFDVAQQFNTRVGVHISDLGLLNIKEVDVIEDSCTDVLQEWLNEGWRIIAVCPQPNKRRPDYIVGRNERMEDRKRRRSTCS